MKKKFNKKLILIIVGLIVLITVIVAVSIKSKRYTIGRSSEETEIVEEPKKKDIKVVDIYSKTRPYAITVNNTPGAVKVQEGLNKAYLVYEIPTEGYTSRLLAFFKDVDDVTVGTIRSARHNFMDYARESDAIFVCFGWSHYAQDELNKGGTDFLNGNEKKWKSAFWRNNPEGLATEHTAYTSTGEIKKYITDNNYRLESENSEDTILLNYSEEEINLDDMEGVKTANKIVLPYGNITTEFHYNSETKEYTKIVNNKEIKDHNTNESITTKNIIIAKIGHYMASDKYYWDLDNTGHAEGYYITNGKAVPIEWYKDSRNARTKYKYLNGEEITVNDGRTYIELHLFNKSVTIE